MSYYIRYQGRKQGPLSEAQLTTLLSRGTVTKETEASLNEIDWLPLGDLPEFERLYAQIVAKQLKQATDPAAPTGTYDLRPPAAPFPPAVEPAPENDAFVRTGFSPKEPDGKLDGIMKQRAVKTETAGPAANGSAGKNPRLLYAVLGGAVAMVLLLAVLAVVFSGTAPPVDRQDGITPEETAFSETESDDGQVDDLVAEIVKPAAPEPIPDDLPEPERMEIETVAKIVTETIVEKSDENIPPPSAIEWNEIVSPLNSVFPVKALSLDAFGGVAMPESVGGDLAGLYPVRERIRFRYVSYVPGNVFSSEKSREHEILVSRDGTGILRLSLVETGLKAEWLDSPDLTVASYKTFNGALLAELEILRVDTDRVLKTVSLFTPISKTERFSMSARQVVLDGLDVDLDALNLDGQSLKIRGIRNLYKGGKRETISGDTIRYFFLDDGKEHKVDIRAIAQSPVRSKEGVWRIPIQPEAEFPPSKEDADMIDRIRSFIGLNVDRSRALAAQNMARKNRAIDIADEIGAGAGVTLSVLNDFDREFRAQKSVLHRRNAAAYKKYLEVVENYRERLDKARRITMAESVCFDIALVHPGDENKTILFVEVGNKEKLTNNE